MSSDNRGQKRIYIRLQYRLPVYLQRELHCYSRRPEGPIIKLIGTNNFKATTLKKEGQPYCNTQFGKKVFNIKDVFQENCTLRSCLSAGFGWDPIPTVHISSDRPVYSIGLRTNTTTDEPFPFVRMEPAHKEYYNAGTNSPTVLLQHQLYILQFETIISFCFK